MFRNIFYYLSGGLLLASLTAYFFKRVKKPENKRETDLQRLINGNKRFIDKKYNNINKNSRILVIKLFSGLNPKVIFDSPYVDVVSSSKFCHNTLKVIENMFYENQYDTMVVLNIDDENKNAKIYLQELLNESKFLRSLTENKKLKPYWASYDSIYSYVTFHNLFNNELNIFI